jgi:hypothetical protein
MKKLLGIFVLVAAFTLPGFAQWQGRLSRDDQKEFDKAYAKWVNDTRKNDRDDLDKDVRRMQEIMARYSIPSDVPFDRIASGAYQNAPVNSYPSAGYQSYAGRLSPEDQHEFDRYYSRWMEDTRKGDRDDIQSDVTHMQEIMARYSIPTDVPFDRIATVTYGSSSDYAGGYRSYDRWHGRLSPDDQHEFDKAYAEWVEDTRKHDRDDIPKDTRKMQDIMARYNIPADVPFDAIASPNAALSK